MYRVVFLFEELGDLRFVSHLDLVSIIERTCRRADLPLKFSQGFNPHPKIAFAYPLSVGVSSNYELMDIDLEEMIEIPLLIKLLNDKLPPGLRILNAKVTDSKDSLMSLVRFAEYELSFTLSEPITQEAFQKALDAELWLHQKINKKKKYIEQNIRPMIIALALTTEGNRHTLKMKIHHSSETSVKPETVYKTLLKKLGIEEEPSRVRIHRLSLIGMHKSGEKDLFNCL